MDLLNCNWDTARFLIFSENVYDPLIYYSHLGPLIASLIIGLFVFFKDRKALINRLLFFLTVTFSLWVYLDMILWATEKPEYTMFFWQIMAPVELLLYFLALSLVYAFITKDNFPFKAKLVSLLFFLPIILLTHSPHNLSAYDFTNCDREAFEGSLWQYIYYVEIFIIAWIISLVFLKYKHIKEEKRQTFLFIAGVLFLLITFSFGNFTILFGEVGWEYEQYKLFGMPIFVGFLSYLIVRYKAFNAKLLGAQALVTALVILIGSMFFFAESSMNKVLIGITLALSFVFGIFLIKSVKNEVQRKEELQVMSDKLAGANDQLRKLDNAKSEFISIASHQLRTPLTAIKGFISLLLEGSYGKLVPQQEDVLNKVYTSNERLVNLVEDLLNISRIESGRMEFKFDNWDMDKICQEVIDTFVLRAKDKKLDLEYIRPENPLPEIMIDGTKVREVISNLVDNAIKYTLEGHGGVRLKLEQLAENIRVTVFDSGIGIPESELPYLFAKFSRGKDTSRLNTGGTGLGLYVGKQMIENNGGRIWAESDGEGLGSRFIIEIPIQQDEELLKKWG